MQSRNFRLQRVGDINWLEKNYRFKDIAFSLDEIVVLNVTKEEKNINVFAQAVERLVEGTYIPVAAGGGIRSVKDAELLFNSGADKIVLNSMLFEDASLIKELVKIYGSQSIVACIDYKLIDGNVEVYINNGTRKLDLNYQACLELLAELKVGEVYLNSIDRDGTGFGYEYGLVNLTYEYLRVPIIIAGGAGNEKHLLESLAMREISAAATANLFNFVGDGLPNARNYILEMGGNIANWNVD